MPKKQKDGRYRAKITVGTNADGKAIVKYVSGQTKRELEEAKQAAIAYFIKGTALEDDQLFSNYALEWYKTKKEPHLSDSSKMGYTIYLNAHILPEFGERNLRAIRAMEIQGWLNGYAGKSKTAIVMLKSIMTNVMKSAFAEGIISRDPAAALIAPKSSEVEERRALTAEETKAILVTVKRHPDGAFLAVLYYLGLRRGEALGLQWGDFNWSEGSVHIQRDVDYADGGRGKLGSLKTPAAYRYVTIPDDLRDMLYPERGHPNGLLFPSSAGSVLPRVTQQRLWVFLMVDAGLATPVEPEVGEELDSDIRFRWKPIITPHYLRHNYVTMLYDAGVDPLMAMRLVGHSDYKTTANIYTHLKEQHLHKVAHKLEHVFQDRACQKDATK